MESIPPLKIHAKWDQDRSTKSLHVLARKFVELMRASDIGVVNLREAGEKLDVKQKRRIYDITNVLEGIGLIQKLSKNTVQWRGFIKTGVSKTLNNRLETLNLKEKYLDEILNFAKRNIKFMIRDPDTRTLSYVTRDDLLHCYEDQVVLTAKGLHKAERLPVMENDTIILGRGLRIVSQDEDRPIEVCLATDEGKALIKTNENDDYKPEPVKASRKSKPTVMAAPMTTQSIPSHWGGGKESDDHRELLKKFQEYKKEANILLNIRKKDPIRDRRNRLRNFYQAKTPFIKLTETLGADYCFTLHDDEGVCDLYDIPTVPSLTAQHEELAEEDDDEENFEHEIMEVDSIDDDDEQFLEEHI